MKGQGAIRINIVKESEQFVFIDISDTGKGIEKRCLPKSLIPALLQGKRLGLGFDFGQTYY